MSRTSPSSSTVRHRSCWRPLRVTNTASRYHVSPRPPRRYRSRLAYVCPNGRDPRDGPDRTNWRGQRRSQRMVAWSSLLADPRSLVILPTYNERDNLPVVVPALLRIPHVELLVVDDGSPDGTGDIADALVSEHEWSGLRAASNRSQRARRVPHRWDAACSVHRRGADLPDGCGPVARSRRRFAPADRQRARGPRYRLALRAGRTHRELANATGAVERVCQPIRSHDHGALLHESELARTDPDPPFLHRPMRYDIGLPSTVI